MNERNFIGQFFQPEANGPFPAVLVLGGSEGGLNSAAHFARALSQHNMAALAVAYFGVDSLPPKLEEVPLETVTQAIQWLKDQPQIDSARLAILGGSKGAELALWIAAHEPAVRAVVAHVPSHVIWQGINLDDPTPRSSWVGPNGPLTYTPFNTSEPFTTLRNLYQISLDNLAAVSASGIPVERINGPVMLFSGGDDQIWPSAEMSNEIVARLDQLDFPHPVIHHHYEDAGHAVLLPPFGEDPLRPDQVTEGLLALGGTPAGVARALNDAWPRAVAFLKENLKAVID